VSQTARMGTRSSATRAGVLIAVLCLAGAAAPGRAAAATVRRFSFTGAMQSFVVPADVTGIHVVAIGGRGGTGFLAPAGGFGAVATADITVTPGQQLVVAVGGNGGDAARGVGGAAGFNGGAQGGTMGDAASGKGGGAGGGMSAVYPPEGLLLGWVIAGGGGGSGGGPLGGGGGTGSADDGRNGSAGGLGGGTNGIGYPGGNRGGGGTATGGGVGGALNGANAGTFVAGGVGQTATYFNPHGAGGGGGGGVFGGGGGGEAPLSGDDGGGGGAGSSSIAIGRATNGSYSQDTTGTPSITLTYDVPLTPAATGDGGGTVGGSGGRGGTAGTPALSRVTASRRAFAAAAHGGSTGGTGGTTISYKDTAAATTTFTVLAKRSGIRSAGGGCVARRSGKHGRSCTRWVAVGSFTHTDVAGFNTFTFTGRVHGRKLAKGSYRLRAVARGDGRTSVEAVVGFRIVAAHP
jgi:hypothetical protein